MSDAEPYREPDIGSVSRPCVDILDNLRDPYGEVEEKEHPVCVNDCFNEDET